MSSSIPLLSICPHLPIFSHKETIAQALNEHSVLIIGADTGSGKSTQLPKLLLNSGLTRIGHTLPKRIATQALLNRLHEELPKEALEWIGLQTRYVKQVPVKCRYKIMTDGILLAEVASDPLLRQYQAILIDEAHERSVTIDLLLGALRIIMQKRPDFRLVITSASLQTEKFLNFFQNAKAFSISGRLHPVEIVYHPWQDVQESPSDSALPDRKENEINAAIRWGIERLDQIEKGDILIFLPGEREIYNAIEDLSSSFRDSCLLPLYARLPQAAQQQIFRPSIERRLIFSTNVAETSVTIPRISHVIDTGTARIYRYSTRTQQSVLQVEAISQACAIQRAGRCGREKPGICLRLYAQTDFNHRLAFTEPEIIRGNLASAVLKLAKLGVKDLSTFPLIDPPPTKRINEAIGQLRRLGALCPEQEAHHYLKLTALGDKISCLPLEPALAAVLVKAVSSPLFHEIALVVSALSIDTIFIYSADHAELQKKSHRKFQDPRSDLITYLRLWNVLLRWQNLNRSSFKKKCAENFLHAHQVALWRSTYLDLLDLFKMTPRAQPVGIEQLPYDQFHAYFLPAFLHNIALFRSEKGQYAATFGGALNIHPNSALFGSNPELIVCLKRLETTKKWGCCCAKISRNQLEHVFRKDLKWHYEAPYWDAESGFVYCKAKGTLLSLTLVPERRRLYSTIDPKLAREIFLRNACLRGDWQGPKEFYGTNQKFLKDREKFFHKLRNDSILLQEEELLQWLSARVPTTIDNTAAFCKWWKQLHPSQRQTLFFECDPALALGQFDRERAQQCPDEWVWQGHRFPILYRFSPGEIDDGLTVLLPLSHTEPALGAELSWNLPCYQEQMVTARLFKLPSKWRRQQEALCDLIAQKFLPHCTQSSLPLEMALHQFLYRNANWGETLEKTLTYWKDLPSHLVVKFQWKDPESETTRFGHHWTQWPGLYQLSDQENHSEKKERKAGRHSQFFVQSAMINWNGPRLASFLKNCWRHADLRCQTLQRLAPHDAPFPCLKFSSGLPDVRLEWTQTAYQQLKQQEETIIKILCIALKTQSHAARFKGSSLQLERLRKLFRFSEIKVLQQSVLFYTIKNLIQGDVANGAIWNESDFLILKKRSGEQLSYALNQTFDSLFAIVDAYHLIEEQFRRTTLQCELRTAVENWLEQRFFPHGECLSPIWMMSMEDLTLVPRYIEAVQRRLQDYWRAPAREKEFEQHWSWFQEKMRDAKQAVILDIDPLSRLKKEKSIQNLEQAFNEFSISLFAQELKTLYPISKKRLEKMFEAFSNGSSSALVKSGHTSPRRVSLERLNQLQDRFQGAPT